MGEYMDKWLPELKKGNRQMSQAGLGHTAKRNTTNPLSEIVGDILKGRSPEALDMIAKTPEEVQAARDRLAVKNFQCPVCQDFKFVYPRNAEGKVIYEKSVPCVCVRKAAEENKKARLLKYCEIPSKGKNMTFSNFQVSTSTREAYDACLTLAEAKSENKFLTLTGPSTRGKTHLAIAVCNYRLERGQLAKYAYVPIFLDELREGFKHDGDESYMSRYEIFKTVPLLTLDDLGTENPTPWAQEHLDTLIDYRLMNELSTLITTNLPLSQIPFRIAHRLERDGVVIVMKGPKYEVKK
jgi:DNA replication protein DnaC